MRVQTMAAALVLGFGALVGAPAAAVASDHHHHGSRLHVDVNLGHGYGRSGVYTDYADHRGGGYYGDHVSVYHGSHSGYSGHGGYSAHYGSYPHGDGNGRHGHGYTTDRPAYEHSYGHTYAHGYHGHRR